MKDLLRGFAVAFSMYTIIPMPQVEWNKKSMRYAYCFYPLAGAVIGFLLWIWIWAGQELALSPLLYAVVAALLPVLVSGGIHMDGLIDSCDALFSYGDQEKKLTILKDSHVGAFGVLGCVGYLLLLFGLQGQLYARPSLLPIVAVGFVFSRALGALTVVSFPCAKNSGLAHTFSDAAAKRPVRVVLTIYLALCLLLFLDCSVVAGRVIVLLIGLLFLWFYRMSKKQFGGITGDLCGLLVQLTELMILMVCALMG